MSVVRIACGTCGKTIEADIGANDELPLPAFFPFCCERCRLVDLGKWFDEEYRVSRPAGPGTSPPEE